MSEKDKHIADKIRDIQEVDLKAYWEDYFDNIDWSEFGKSTEQHREGTTDLEWASMQPMHDPVYMTGDIVEVQIGGYGIIREVQKAHGGWPTSYSISEVKGLPFKGRVAWFYELDFKRLVQESAVRSLQRKQIL